MGTGSYDTVRQTRFDEQMVVLHDSYNGKIPDMLEQAWARIGLGSISQRQCYPALNAHSKGRRYI
jgi:hypothetical protein